MKSGDKQNYRSQPLRRGKLIPVRGHEQQDAGAQREPTEADRQDGGPVQALVLRPVRFEGANLSGGDGVDKSGGLPALENAFPPFCQGRPLR